MPTQTQIEYAKRIADKYISRDGSPPIRRRPGMEPLLQALLDVELLAPGRHDWQVHCRCAMPRTMEEITAILEKTP